MKQRVANVLQLAGLLTAGTGLYLIAPAVLVLVAGLLALAVGVWLER